MSPIPISTLKLAARNLVKSSNVNLTSKLFISYSRPAPSYYDMYNESHPIDHLYNQANAFKADTVNNNGCGSVEKGDMTFINNSAHQDAQPEDAKFVPKVSSEEDVSGHGHNKV